MITIIFENLSDSMISFRNKDLMIWWKFFKNRMQPFFMRLVIAATTKLFLKIFVAGFVQQHHLTQ